MKKNANEGVITGCRIDAALMASLRKVAKQQDRSVSQCIRRAVRRYVASANEEPAS